MTPIETWGGPECTVNRVGDRYRDQIAETGHRDRPADLDQFADLGFSALRYPMLWESVRQCSSHWDWLDARVRRIRSLGMRPIAGLVHHGSGPPHTSLLDPDFASGLAAHAAAVAQRYDWIGEWTPVNEPLTTARFSALYGHWYPHAADERSFWLALLNQVDATRLSMAAVRRVRSDAMLVQTDDLGRTYAKLGLADQAEFDNLRRWAGWDLLFGRVTPDHPLFGRLAVMGLGDRLRAIADAPCPPDVIGVNHYLTSDRFLDDSCERYPPELAGGNGRERYVDIEAVRVLEPAPPGYGGVLREAWQRYRTPLALTEVHNGCTREEQLRWVAECWDTACTLQSEGVEIRAVTAWALLGSQGWNTLLRDDGEYEPGVFDVSGAKPRPTALARLWQGLRDDAPRHPVAATPGWWRRTERLLHAPVAWNGPGTPPVRESHPLRLAGAWSQAGQAILTACTRRGIAVTVDGPGGAGHWGVVEAVDNGVIRATSHWPHACSFRLDWTGVEPGLAARIALDLLIDGVEGSWSVANGHPVQRPTRPARPVRALPNRLSAGIG